MRREVCKGVRGHKEAMEALAPSQHLSGWGGSLSREGGRFGRALPSRLALAQRRLAKLLGADRRGPLVR